MRQIAILLIILAIGGCTISRSHIDRGHAELPDSFSGTSDEVKPSASIGRWWESFRDPGLNTFMEEVLNNNPDIIRAYERMKQQEALFRITDSSRGLILNIEGSAGRSRQPGLSGSMTSDSYSLSAAASYEIDLWKKLESRSRAAELDKLASKEDLRAIYITVSAELVDLHYLAQEQTAQLKLSEQIIESFSDTLERVEGRYQAGTVPALDLYQSRQNLLSAEAEKHLFESRLSVTLNAISVLAGRFPSREDDNYSYDLPEIEPLNTGIPSQLLKRRPDIRATLLRLEADDSRISAAIADRFPSFNLVGSYGGSSTKLRTILDSPNILWTIAVQAIQPVLDAGRRKAEVERTEAVYREKMALYHKTVLTAFKEVEDALARGRASKERIGLIVARVSASESSLRLVLDRYMQGVGDYLPVLDAQQRFYNARRSLLTERRQLISDRVQLARALGGEWMDEYLIDNK